MSEAVEVQENIATLERNQVINGDAIEVLRTMPENSVDAVVTDPPYGLNFMGKKWDYDVPGVELWTEVYRVMKPGAFLLAFSGTRTYHRMAVNIEDAGFEIRDQIQWIYGEGFPKSLDVSKAIDKELGAKREVVGERRLWGENASGGRGGQKANDYQETEIGAEKFIPITAPASEEAKEWDGWGTSLKPANEPICLARKPISEATIAKNVLKWGTGVLNIDGCRIELNGDYKCKANGRPSLTGLGDNYNPQEANQGDAKGRWPANVILDEEAAEYLDQQSGERAGCQPHSIKSRQEKYEGWGSITKRKGEVVGYKGTGGASRFFYVAKASRSERNAGLEGMPKKMVRWSSGDKNPGSFQSEGTDKYQKNHHPTVKPLTLCRYLVKMITPPGGVVLDCFAGSGSIPIGAKLEGFDYIGIEKEKDYCEIAERRLKHWVRQEELL